MTALCFGRPSDWWETGDDGNRLALALCRVCPERVGIECAAGMPDPDPHGVIRAGVAYTERGRVAPLCPACGYPDDKVPDARRTTTLCRRCLPVAPRAWRQDRRRYWADYYRRRKAARDAARAAA